MYKLFTIKRYVEQIIMFPFVFLGKLIALLKPLKEEYDVFFFFPGFAIGGAERVNAEIIKSVSDKKVIIFFTKNSPNAGMRHFFELPHVTIREINYWTDKKWMYWGNLMYRGICSTYINRQKKKTSVFIGQCNFAYKLTPHIRRDIKINELIHMYDPKFTWVWAPFVQFIDTRIIVGEIFKTKFATCYREAGIPPKYLERLKIIFYRLEYLPEEWHKRNFELPLKVYYAGRGGPQKRVWIIVEIIKQCRELNLPLTFKLAGPILDELPEEFIQDGTYVGELQGGKEMYDFHKANDILLMTSAWEGFPLVIMEAMAFGAIPLVSNIDAIPEHIQHGENGFLIENVTDEKEMVKEILANLQEIIKTSNDLQSISINAFSYAFASFDAITFKEKYRKLIFDS
jgi:glycosyltransferase involved in cell wall biosynthesis